jgi:DNA-binding CsgD family transcriptional regulator
VTEDRSPDTQPVPIPFEILSSLRNAAFHELAKASQEIVVIAQTPGHLAHPEWYGDAFAHLDETRALLDDLGWTDTDGAPSEVRLNVATHGASLLMVVDRVRTCLRGDQPTVKSRLLDNLQSTLEDRVDVPAGSGPLVRPQVPGRTHVPLSALTPRETEILAHLSRSRSYDEIAALLSIDIETVRTHARRVRHKLGVRTSRELIGVYVSESKAPKGGDSQ